MPLNTPGVIRPCEHVDRHQTISLNAALPREQSYLRDGVMRLDVQGKHDPSNSVGVNTMQAQLQQTLTLQRRCHAGNPRVCGVASGAAERVIRDVGADVVHAACAGAAWLGGQTEMAETRSRTRVTIRIITWSHAKTWVCALRARVVCAQVENGKTLPAGQTGTIQGVKKLTGVVLMIG